MWPRYATDWNVRSKNLVSMSDTAVRPEFFYKLINWIFFSDLGSGDEKKKKKKLRK